ncbi:MAG: hypothetical protein HQL36_09620 [Alphaproteobacteria bacterium]|nr:hypothetical protein [Alphaproteobacteria bacterium]
MTKQAHQRFVWTSDMETGNTLVDREHKASLDLMNLLTLVDEQENPGMALMETVAALERFTSKHFKHEEDLLDAVDSPDLALQGTQHNMLRRELSVMVNAIDAENPGDTIHGIVSWVERRLLRHLNTFDMGTFSKHPFR